MSNVLPSQEKVKAWSVTGTVQINMREKHPSVAYSIVLAQNRIKRAGSPLTEFFDEQSEHTLQAIRIL